jgi:apolipoprotein N-acyltransferase
MGIDSLIAFTLAVTTGILYATLFAPLNFAFAAWVALVPLIWAVDGKSPARAALLAGCFGFVTTLIITAWLAPTSSDYFERSALTTIAFVVVVAALSIAPYFALAFGLLAYVQPRVGRFVWLAMIPLAWVSAEYARSQLGLRSSWSLLGTSQIGSPLLRQLADITGVYGVSGLIAMGNAVLAEALRVICTREGHTRSLEPKPRGPVLQLGCAFAGLLALAIAHGSERMGEESNAEGTDVAIVQGNVDQSLRWKRGEALRVLRRYADLSEDALGSEAGPPDLIVWPESALQNPVRDTLYGPALARLVAKLDTTIVLGAPRRDEEGNYNSASILEPGVAIRDYDKMRLLPFSEVHPIDLLTARPTRGDDHVADYVAGTRAGIFDWRGQRLGILICFEAIYPEMARTLAANGASVIFNLSNDGWFRGTGGPEQHLQQVIFRAIESGVPVVRATSTGISAVISPTGEIVAQLADGESGVLRARIPAPRPFPTIYVRYGDLFAHACCAALLIGALLCLLGESRRRRGALPFAWNVSRHDPKDAPEAA